MIESGLTPLDDPTRCFVPDCTIENEILLHVTAEPHGFSDLCLPHARQCFHESGLMLTCDCAFCLRARAKFLDGAPQ